jgi:serine/threonine protein kinase/tetratricopeptide (TPR) repeat protein
MNDKIEAIFADARELEGEDRCKYLDDACSGDPELRARVEALLGADMDAGSFLISADGEMEVSGPAAGNRSRTGVPKETAGQMIGAYKLLQIIGEGGFGTVWMADQHEPVKRRVALKILKVGMDTKQVVSRFEVERQALAMMDHPNIAKVFDAGSTDSGRPFFVMELVNGVSILEYCDVNKLDTETRLHLFTLVCHAIQHAHQKGIIHRDIKPGNVLVTMHDGVPVPKVIDFGIAKATDQELTQRTFFTEFRHLIGTPVYMSPEQAEMSGLDIDTRSDVYSLGVLLYELLTSTPPFAHDELMERGYAEMMRIIREETPHKPSTRLSSLDKSRVLAAEQRHTDIKKLGMVLRGDLDWIVMKCLEKDRTRRYGTVTGLAEDIFRHLNDEPVVAGPPSAGYKLSKFVKRNRGRVAAAALVVAALILGVVGTSYGMLWAIHERDVAVRAESQLSQRAEELQQVADFQGAQLRDLDPQRMGLALRRSVFENTPEDVREQLEENLSGVNFTSIAMGMLEDAIFVRTIDAIDSQFADQPLIQAQLLQSSSETMKQLGFLRAAQSTQERTLAVRREQLGDDHPDTLDSINTLGSIYQLMGSFDDAELYVVEVMDRSRRVLGDDHPSTLDAINNMGALRQAQGRFDEAESYIQEALEGRRRVLGDDHPRTLTSINFMGLLRADQGNPAAAEVFYREAFEGRRNVLGKDHPQTLRAMGNLASELRKLGRLTEAEQYYREVIEGYRLVYGDDHPDSLLAMSGIGIMLYSQRKYDEAEPYYREALAGLLSGLGKFHPYTLSCTHNLAALLEAKGNVAEAELYFRQVFDGRARLFGSEHPSTLNSMNSLAYVIKVQGRLDEAESYYRKSLEARRRVLGNDHPSTLTSISNLGSLLQDKGELEEAEEFYRESLEARRRVHGDRDIKTLISFNNYGSLLNAMERFQDAALILSEGEPLARTLWNERTGLLGSYLFKLGQAQFGVGQFLLAETALLEAHALFAEEDGEEANTQIVITRLIELYEKWDRESPTSGHAEKMELWKRLIAEPD